MKDEKLAVKKMSVSGYGIVAAYEWCNQKMYTQCSDPVVGIAIATNMILLEKKYKEIAAALWNERTDPQWNEWLKAEQGIAEKYADRNNSGEIVRDSAGRAVVTEQAVEATKELNSLTQGEFKEAWEKFNAKREENGKILSEMYEVDICCIQDWNVKLDDITPNVLRIFMCDTMKELLNFSV